jgi:betaine-aldehyde dehydrogenase
MFQSFVNGKSIAGKLRPLFNSYTLEQYGLACDMADPDIAIHAAKTAPPNPDRTILLKVAALLQRDRLELAKLESQAGKPLSQSLQDVDSACEVFTYYSSYCGNLVGQSFGYDSRTVRYPIGVCGLITSYNYPLLLAAWKTAPCIAAGNVA